MKTMLTLVAVTSLMLAAVVACGKKADGAETSGQASTTAATVSAAKASCSMVAALGTCNEYRSGQAFGLEKSLCEGYQGTFANGGCGALGQIGSCTMSDGEVKRYYGAKIAGEHALTLEEAKSDCRSESIKGVFTADPNAAAAMAPMAKSSGPQGVIKGVMAGAKSAGALEATK